MNKRRDEFGGSVENMAKILIEIFNQTRDELGKKFPITVKLQTFKLSLQLIYLMMREFKINNFPN